MVLCLPDCIRPRTCCQKKRLNTKCCCWCPCFHILGRIGWVLDHRTNLLGIQFSNVLWHHWRIFHWGKLWHNFCWCRLSSDLWRTFLLGHTSTYDCRHTFRQLRLQCRIGNRLQPKHKCKRSFSPSYLQGKF